MKKHLLVFMVLLVTSLFPQSVKIDSLQAILKKGISDSIRMVVNYELGELLLKNNFEKSLVYSEKALELAKQMGFKEKIIDYRNLVSLVYKRIGNYRKAESLLKENLKDSEAINNLSFLRITHQDLGAVYINLGNFEKAITHLIKAAEISKKLSDNPGLAGIYANIGLTLVSNNDTEKALYYLQESLKLYEELKNQVQIVGSNLRIARVYLKNKENEKALEYQLTALKRSKGMNNKVMLSTVYGEIASTYLNLRQLPNAKLYAEKSLLIKRETGNKRGVASTLYTLGSIYIESGNYKEALLKLNESYAMFKEMDAKEQIMELQKTISNLYKRTGNYKQAYNFYHGYSVLHDSLLNETNHKLITETETKFRVKEKEAELELRNSQIKFQQIILIGIIIISLLLILLLFLAYRNIKQRKHINEQLAQLDKSKSRFFANISHDLRTPLTLVAAPLINLIDNCKDKILSNELKLMKSNVNKILQLTEEVFELSKLESGLITINKAAVNLKQLCGRIFFAYQSLAQFRKLNYRFEFYPDEKTIALLDINKFEKIINNLISNAFKYSSSGGSILFKVEQLNGTLKFIVKDDGQGIHPDDIQNIFNRYYQTKMENQPQRGGAGIGLSIVKEFTKLLGGEITVNSEWNKGSEFVLTLPFEEAEERAIIENENDYEQLTNESGTKDYIPLLINGNKPKILVVEDNLEMNKYLMSLLQRFYLCTGVPDGKEALNIMEQEKFDLIISDIMMPNMDGFEFRENVIKNNDWKLTPFIMLTARTPEEDKIKGFQLGIDDYITKPFNPNELLARILNLLTNKAERDLWKIENPEDAEEEQILSAEKKLLSNAEEYIIKNLDNINYTASELANDLAYSQRQLERLLKKFTGLSPNAFIREIRLHKAYIMLEKRQFNTVLEVCYNVGIENPSYFSKKFYERFGKKPSQLISSF